MKKARPQGFATFTPEKQKEVSSLGGKTAWAMGKAHRWNSDEARLAGKKGGRPKKNKEDSNYVPAKAVDFDAM